MSGSLTYIIYIIFSQYLFPWANVHDSAYFIPAENTYYDDTLHQTSSLVDVLFQLSQHRERNHAVKLHLHLFEMALPRNL